VTALAVIAAIVLVLLAPLVWAAVRQRGLVAMAVRNIARRRSEAVLVVAGALLGTAIITSSLVVGDVIEGSFADEARTGYGPVDVTVTPGRTSDVAEVAASIATARIDGIDGLLAVTTGAVTLEHPAHEAALPRVDVVELDLSDARRFGADPAITGVADARDITSDEVILNDRTAEELGVAVGDRVRLHAYGSTAELTVADIVPEVGLAGYGGAIVVPGTFAELADASMLPAAAPAEGRVLVSLAGGVFDTRDVSDRIVADLQSALVGTSGVEVEATKAAVLDEAERLGGGLTELFSTIGVFSVIAGILLLINLFVMLAEERKTELGMLRAVGFTRRRLTRAFAIEGTIYAIIASILGAVVGVGVGWLVAVVAGSVFGTDGQGSSYPLVVEPLSLAIGAAMGLVIALATIWATSVRIARLNIIRAIRDLPEPKLTRARVRTLVLGAFGVLAGAAMAFVGISGELAIPLLLGIPIAALSATPLLRRILAERAARLLVAGTVLAWGLVVYPLFPDALSAAGIIAFVVQGVVLTIGAVAMASGLDRAWTYAIEHLGRGSRGLAPRLGIAYPLARRFRTSMLLGMFSLVIFTVTILTTFSSSLGGNSGATAEQMAAGYDLMLDTNPANPADSASLLERDDVAAVTGLSHGVATFESDLVEGAREWEITGFDAGLLERGTPTLFRRDPMYATDIEVYRAVLEDPALAIVPENFLVSGVDLATFQVGDTFTVIEPGTGAARELTIAALADTDWLENGALVSRDLTAALFGEGDVETRFYVAGEDGIDVGRLAVSLNAAYLEQGVDARTFAALGAEGVKALTGFLALLRGFLAFGLLVGIAGLGVVMVRAVRERRQEIGMLRAMGFGTGLIRTAMLSEAGLIAIQGTLIGAVLGLITCRQLLASSDSFGDVAIPFVVPWLGLAVILAFPLLASLAVTAWPASRAARIRPAVALRTAD
jgi:putative ABC transport system permease protein